MRTLYYEDIQLLSHKDIQSKTWLRMRQEIGKVLVDIRSQNISVSQMIIWKIGRRQVRWQSHLLMILFCRLWLRSTWQKLAIYLDLQMFQQNKWFQWIQEQYHLVKDLITAKVIVMPSSSSKGYRVHTSYPVRW